MTELEKIIERFERGYTATLYGTVDLANFQKEYDFMELILIVKKLSIHNVSEPFYCKCKEPIMIYKKDEQPSCSDCGGLE